MVLRLVDQVAMVLTQDVGSEVFSAKCEEEVVEFRIVGRFKSWES